MRSRPFPDAPPRIKPRATRSNFVFGTWHYWYFNIADSCIVVGAILYGIALLTAKKAREVAPVK